MTNASTNLLFSAEFYAGGCYAVRRGPRDYLTLEVNGNFSPGNGPVLEAVRAFALSPFAGEEGDVLYVGGFDANFKNASDRAWIFKANLRTVLHGLP